MQDYISPQIGIPVALVLFFILFFMILHDRRKLNQAIHQRPTLKIMNDNGEWVEVKKSETTPIVISRRPVRNFYDQDRPDMGQQPLDYRYEPRVRSNVPKPPKGSSA